MWRFTADLARLAMLPRGSESIIAWDLLSIRSRLSKNYGLFVLLYRVLSTCSVVNLPIELSGDWMIPAP